MIVSRKNLEIHTVLEKTFFWPLKSTRCRVETHRELITWVILLRRTDFDARRASVASAAAAVVAAAAAAVTQLRKR